MLLTSRKPADPDPTTDHEPPTTVTMGTRSPWSGSWSARPQARPRASREPRTGHRVHPAVPRPATAGRPRDARPTDPHTDAQTQATRSPRGACAVVQPDLRTRRAGTLGPTAQPHRATRLRRILGRLRSPIAHRPYGAAQSGAQQLRTGGEGGVVGPTMSPTTAARRLCCRIVTDGRGLWPSAWSGSADELTAWNTRTPPPLCPPAASRWWARCAALATAHCLRQGQRDERLRDRGPPWRDGG